MDLPAACPYCDSQLATYTFLPAGEPGTGTLVFTCTHCGSHVESRVTDFEPAADTAVQIAPGVPAQRLELKSEAGTDREHSPSAPSSLL